MHDLGLIVWLVIVLIGVVSSIRRTAMRSRATLQARQMPGPSPSPAPAPAPAPPVIAVQAPPPRKPQPAPAPVPVPVAAAVGTSPIRGMFGGSTSLVRAIVAAQVLGPPTALQEHSIWSPRHSEPSI
ncbi:MAG TPA: hypothetical protein VMD47_12495 [Candidatus Acidoferrales bacterium]|nr:hypothetical protein [Candidatus Acidoferrales bacterium]